MATIAVTQITTAGVAPPTFVAAAGGGDQFANNGKTLTASSRSRIRRSPR
jgi:hypothetical protein